MSEITDVEEIYTEEYHAKAGVRGEKQYPAKQDMAAGIHRIWQPRSVIDVGCGRGWWMEYWLLEHPYRGDGEGTCVVGVDGCANLIKRNAQCIRAVAQRMFSVDLRHPGWAGRLQISMQPSPMWDVTLCIEVAEHLEEEHAPHLVRQLTTLSDRIFFSAARPGQRGRHHVNCRPKAYWAKIFRSHGYDWRMDLYSDWLAGLDATGRFGANIRRNAMFLTRGER